MQSPDQPRAARRRPYWLALIWLTALVGAAAWQLVAPVALDADPAHLSESPSGQHWLGTDPYGRDVLNDLLGGTRNLLLISLPAAAAATVLGGALGAATGYWADSGLRVRLAAVVAGAVGITGLLLSEPGVAPWWLLATGLGIIGAYRLPGRAATVALPLDQLVLTLAAFTGAIPRLILVLLLAAVHAPSGAWLVAVLALSCWAGTARLTRTLVRQLRRQPFVEAGRAAGYSDLYLLRRHLLPNSWPVLRATLPLNLTICLGLQTTLAFLGVGISPDQPDWGRTLANARLEPGAWWLILGGVGCLVITLAALHQLLPSRLRENQG